MSPLYPLFSPLNDQCTFGNSVKPTTFLLPRPRITLGMEDLLNSPGVRGPVPVVYLAWVTSRIPDLRGLGLSVPLFSVVTFPCRVSSLCLSPIPFPLNRFISCVTSVTSHLDLRDLRRGHLLPREHVGLTGTMDHLPRLQPVPGSGMSTFIH